MNIRKLYFVLTLTVVILVSGIGNMYVQRKGEHGWVFHIFTQKMSAKSNQHNVAGHVDFDYTFVEDTDSVSMLSTVKFPIGTKPVSIDIVSAGKSYNFSPEIIYVKPKGKMSLEYRFKISFPFSIWNEIYESPLPFSLQYNTILQETEHTASFGYDKSKWGANQKKMLAIIEIIKYNTNKL
ncbi:MAG: hypothetical protein K2M93_07100 [Muribaculaceae bacterium]|nr:hypothetical protein [Muribaculaceae bacterium]